VPAAARRTCLREFLSDPCVVEIPGLVGRFILNFIIVLFRSLKSAAKYASLWSNDGSPLKIWTEKRANLLQGWLGMAGHRVNVRYAECHTTGKSCDGEHRIKRAPDFGVGGRFLLEGSIVPGKGACLRAGMASLPGLE
jgi:Ferrochelatase